MTNKVKLEASGYTWECPECKRHNYTGPAPEEVCCEGCKGVFRVSDLSHRRSRSSAEMAHSDNGRRKPKEGVPPELQARLFPSESDDHDFDESNDIPF
jgi:hypothetical protein